jgi:hypothetical protein
MVERKPALLITRRGAYGARATDRRPGPAFSVAVRLPRQFRRPRRPPTRNAPGLVEPSIRTTRFRRPARVRRRSSTRSRARYGPDRSCSSTRTSWGAQTQQRIESGRFAGRSNKCTPRAQHACRPASPDHEYYRQVARRIDHNRACLSVARKLCRRAYHILRELGDEALAPIDAPTDEEVIAAAA